MQILTANYTPWCHWNYLYSKTFESKMFKYNYVLPLRTC